MNKHEFAASLAERCDFSKAEASRALDGILGALTDALTDRDEVSFPGWGKFSAQHRRGREARDPRQPNRRIHVAPGYVPKFKPGANLRREVQGAFADARGSGTNGSSRSSDGHRNGADAGAEPKRIDNERVQERVEVPAVSGVWRPLAAR
jgi:DNA-binding protein HU-beta